MKNLSQQSVSVVIPTYNARHLLEKHLPTVASCLQKGDEIVIADDASQDDTQDWIQKNVSQYEKKFGVTLKTVLHSQNKRFAAAVNSGTEAASHEYIWLLNNDVTPLSHDIRSKLLGWFSQANLFAVGCAEVQENTPNAQVFGRGTGNFERGLLVHWYDPQQDTQKTLWTSGGSMMFRKSFYQELNGMDTVFAPAYEEDRDLSYRALKHGWSIAFDYSARVWHQHETTNKSVFGLREMEVNSWKNQFLLVWKNISDPTLILQHLLWLPYHLTLTNTRTKGATTAGFFRALKQLPQLIHSRSQSAQTWKKSDQAVLSQYGTTRP